ncbi:MAG: hypothetical protein ACRCTQ_01905 [Brevinemataceae bacterium]
MTRFEQIFWSRAANIHSGWARVGAVILYPFAFYTRDWFIIAVSTLILFILPFCFGKATSSMKHDFIYQSVRGYFLIRKNVASYQSNMWNSLMTKKSFRYVLFTIYFMLFVASIVLLWLHYFWIGILMYAMLGFFKWLLAVECVLVSKHNPENELWDSMIS